MFPQSSQSALTVDGLLLVDKPAGMTSHDVVEVIRSKLAIQRVGHSGTLDPMARGLLILLTGRATKCQQMLQAHEKVYEAVLQLGTQTETGDAMGRTIRSAPVPVLDRQRVTELLDSLQGPLRQTPPAYSAVKVRGRPAYWWARQRRAVTLSARDVQLFSLTLLAADCSTITFRVHCSAGTYVRVLAESIAERLGTVGHLSSLVRLRIGDWFLEEALPLPWIAAASREALIGRLQPVPSFIRPGGARAR